MHTELIKAKLFEQSETYQTLKSGDTSFIIGAEKMGNTWLIPKSAEKPADGRYMDNAGETTKQREGAVK